MASTKVVHLTSVHPPLDVRIFYKECMTLASEGYEVVLVAPGDESSVVNGVRIHHVPKAKTWFDRLTRTGWAVYRAAIAEGADLYHFHDPQLIPVGVLLRLRGRTVIYDAHEDFPRQVVNRPWMHSSLRWLVTRLAEVFEWAATPFFDGVVAATPTIARRFPSRKTVTVQNFPIPGELVGGKEVPYSARSAVIAYVGGLAETRGIREMVKAISLVSPSLSAKLVLAGRFSPPRLREDVQHLEGWERVEYLGWVGRDQIARLLGTARVGLAVLHPMPNYVEAYPIKLFEYMAAGLPVVASDFPLWRKIVTNARCGILVDPLRAQDIADALTWLLEHPKSAEEMGKRGQEAVRATYNWETEGRKLAGLYRALLRRTNF